MRDGLDVIAITEPAIGLPLRQDGRDVVIPAECFDIMIPDQLYRVIQRLFAPGTIAESPRPCRLAARVPSVRRS
jgi:hypothetical protein